jgi:hypothetical protein
MTVQACLDALNEKIGKTDAVRPRGLPMARGGVRASAT